MGTVLNPTAAISDGNGNTLILPMLGVVQVTPGGTPMSVGGSDFAVIVDSTTSAGYTYICKAEPGTPSAAAKWQISRIDSNGSKQWAGGTAEFDKIANNRASYTYS